MSQLETKSTRPKSNLPTAAGADRAADLPTPHDFPNSDVVVYDGHCVFCIGQVQKLMKLDGKNRLAFVSLHDPFVAENFSDLSHDELMEQLYLIPNSEQGFSTKRHGGAAAIRYLSRRLPKLWILAPLLHIPFTLPLWQWMYNQVAKRRYKLAGKKGQACDENGTCDLHFKD